MCMYIQYVCMYISIYIYLYTHTNVHPSQLIWLHVPELFDDLPSLAIKLLTGFWTTLSEKCCFSSQIHIRLFMLVHTFYKMG